MHNIFFVMHNGVSVFTDTPQMVDNIIFCTFLLQFKILVYHDIASPSIHRAIQASSGYNMALHVLSFYSHQKTRKRVLI